jgi:hypothetical protein
LPPLLLLWWWLPLGGLLLLLLLLLPWLLLLLPPPLPPRILLASAPASLLPIEGLLECELPDPLPPPKACDAMPPISPPSGELPWLLWWLLLPWLPLLLPPMTCDARPPISPPSGELPLLPLLLLCLAPPRRALTAMLCAPSSSLSSACVSPITTPGTNTTTPHIP